MAADSRGQFKIHKDLPHGWMFAYTSIEGNQNMWYKHKSQNPSLAHLKHSAIHRNTTMSKTEAEKKAGRTAFETFDLKYRETSITCTMVKSRHFANSAL